MKTSRSIAGLPIAVRRALERLGADLSAARRRQRISMAILAERAFISRKTLGKVERGDPTVSMGIYATIVFSLGMIDRVGDLAGISADSRGAALEDERLPKRIRDRGV